MTKDAIQRQLDTLVEFMQTAAYKSFLATIRVDIEATEKGILDNPPIDQASIAASLLAFGKRERLFESLNDFEEACGVLKNELDKMSESHTQTTETETET